MVWLPFGEKEERSRHNEKLGCDGFLFYCISRNRLLRDRVIFSDNSLLDSFFLIVQGVSSRDFAFSLKKKDSSRIFMH